ncbi:AlpA family transcriptional regulator [Azovibrio restrictus]|uniref:helix-turn-helix transcriptional regulator n=1 Tax=Azovibrio restrictus TaxID=146938 RepID=UPI0026F22126|nr:AlpA family phage regulatory protein [Azovibrio restrictus]MDD3481832.1 AlpA family phage regulatory protein [Azovibrio restrictus]
MLALSVSTFQELVRLKIAPQPRKLSGRRVGWLVRELEEWAESRPVSDLSPPPNTGAKKPRGSRQPVSPDDQTSA